MVLLSAWREYVSNLKIALAFSLLGIFVFFFVLFPDAFSSSGSVFFEYSLFKSGFFNAVLELVTMLVYLLFFSIFLSVIIFAVRHDLNEVHMQHYLIEKLPKFVFTNFAFLVLFSLLAIVLSFALISIGLPNALVALVLFVVFSVFMFVPQSIVIDEERIKNALLNALHFFFKNLKMSAFVALVSVALLFAVPLVEIVFDRFSFAGRFVSLLAVLVFILPFIEVLKTVVFLTKFELIKTQI